MDESREKSGAQNLPVQNTPCWNEGMQPSIDLTTASAGPTGASRESRRPEVQVDREIGRAFADALTDILSAEKEPRQRRNVS